MRRSHAAALVTTLIVPLAVPFAAVAADAASSGGLGSARRVVLVTIDGTRLDDWLDPALENLREVMREGSAALLSTRTADPDDDASPGERTDAYRTLGSGAFTDEPDPTAVASALAGRGFATAAITGLASDEVSSLVGAATVEAASIPDASFPTGMRTDYATLFQHARREMAAARLVVVDIGDTSRVERETGSRPALRERWMTLAMRRFDPFLGSLRAALGPEDLLIVASPTPPFERQRSRRFLSAVVAYGPGAGRGTLTSATTRITGLVAITDLAPTIIDALGVEPPTSMTGRPASSVPLPSPLQRLQDLDHDFVHASVVRGVLVRATLIAAMALVVLAFAVVATGRGRATAGVPRGIRDLLQTGLLAAAATPLGLLLEPVWGTSGRAAAAVATFGAAIAIALVLRSTMGAHAGFAAVLGGTAVVALTDLTFGGTLARRSPLSFLVAEGARFHGIGNETMGVVIAASLFSVAWLIDARGGRRSTVVGAIGFALAAAVMASPWAGAKFGAVPTAVPAFGLLLAIRLPGKLTLRRLMAVAIATILATGMALAVDALRDPAVQTHVGRAIGDGGGVGGILARKLGAAGRLLAGSIWIGSLALFAIASGVLVRRRPALVGRVFWGLPATRAALVASPVAAAAAVAANDAGVTAAGWIGLIAASRLFSGMLAQD